MKTVDINNPSKNYVFNVKIITTLLSSLSIRLNLDGDRKIGKWKLSTIPLPLCSFIITDILGLIGNVFYVRDALDRGDTFTAAQVVSHFFSNAIDLAKGIQLLVVAESLEDVMKDFKELWYKYVVNHVLRDSIVKKANKTNLFCKALVGATSFAAGSLGIPPFINLCVEYIHRNDVNYTHNYEIRAFFLKYPFALNTFERYLWVNIYESYFVLGAFLLWMTSDVIFAVLTTHASCQLEILQYDMKKLINSDANEYFLKRSFNTIIRRHLDILRLCDHIESMFSPLVLIALMLSSVNLCFNIFGTNDAVSKKDYGHASVHFSLFIIVIFQITFYCTFAEALTEQTRIFARAAIDAKWVEKINGVGIYIHMLILKSQNPFYFTGFGFFQIGHARLGAILNGAYTYYMVLNASAKK